MEIKIGEYDVLQDGVIIGNENEPIDFIFIKDIGFVIRIIFKTDSTTKEHKVEAEKFDKKGALLTFYNFSSSTGIGNVSPIKIGHIQNRQLFLNYRIYSLNQGGKSFHYTWFLGKEVQNG